MHRVQHLEVISQPTRSSIALRGAIHDHVQSVLQPVLMMVGLHTSCLVHSMVQICRIDNSLVLCELNRVPAWHAQQ